jgi:hypothetical protein
VADGAPVAAVAEAMAAHPGAVLFPGDDERLFTGPAEAIVYMEAARLFDGDRAPQTMTQSWGAALKGKRRVVIDDASPHVATFDAPKIARLHALTTLGESLAKRLLWAAYDIGERLFLSDVGGARAALVFTDYGEATEALTRINGGTRGGRLWPGPVAPASLVAQLVAAGAATVVVGYGAPHPRRYRIDDWIGRPAVADTGPVDGIAGLFAVAARPWADRLADPPYGYGVARSLIHAGPLLVGRRPEIRDGARWASLFGDDETTVSLAGPDRFDRLLEAAAPTEGALVAGRLTLDHPALLALAVMAEDPAAPFTRSAYVARLARLKLSGARLGALTAVALDWYRPVVHRPAGSEPMGAADGAAIGFSSVSALEEWYAGLRGAGRLPLAAGKKRIDTGPDRSLFHEALAAGTALSIDPLPDEPNRLVLDGAALTGAVERLADGRPFLFDAPREGVGYI